MTSEFFHETFRLTNILLGPRSLQLGEFDPSLQGQNFGGGGEHQSLLARNLGLPERNFYIRKTSENVSSTSVFLIRTARTPPASSRWKINQTSRPESEPTRSVLSRRRGSRNLREHSCLHTIFNRFEDVILFPTNEFLGRLQNQQIQNQTNSLERFQY